MTPADIGLGDPAACTVLLVMLGFIGLVVRVYRREMIGPDLCPHCDADVDLLYGAAVNIPNGPFYHPRLCPLCGAVVRKDHIDCTLC